MADIVTYRQSRFGVGVAFAFEDLRLKYSFSDWTGEREFYVPYESIDVVSPAKLTAKMQSPNLALICIVLAGVFMIAGIGEPYPIEPALRGLAIAMIAAALVVSRLRPRVLKSTLLQLTPSAPGRADCRFACSTTNLTMRFLRRSGSAGAIGCARCLAEFTSTKTQASSSSG